MAGCLAILLSGPVNAQHVGPSHEPAQHQVPPDHDHAGVTGGSREGSPGGKAYSEFSHHMAGVFVLLIGLSEVRYDLALTPLAWTRFVLPVAMLGAGGFLMVWSDHEAWPIGSLSFVQTFFGSDWEILQHKLYGIFLMAMGTIELPGRTRRIAQHWWRVPLPVFAILGGLALFLHSHGAHPAAHKIAIHHTIMGILAITVGSYKLASGWEVGRTPVTLAPTFHQLADRSRWGLAWASLILLISIQILVYTE